MSEILQAINPNIVVMVSVGLCLLCVVGVAFTFIMQFVGIGIGIISGVIHFFTGIITGGPLAWCGCLIFLFICSGCGFVTIVLSSIIPKCGTPDAINLCRLLGM